MKKTICLVGGGTGGHVFPLAATYEWLSEEGTWDFLWIGQKKSLEERVAHEREIPFFSICVGKVDRFFSLRLLAMPFLVLAGFFQSLYIFSRHRVDIVFSKGGYVAFPAVLAAWVLGKTVIIHESDSVPGLVSRISARFATCVLLGFPEATSHFGGVRTLPFGQILSPRFIEHDTEIKKTDRTQLLVVGGSQWSRRLFEFVSKNLKTLSEFDITVILGTKNQEVHSWFEGYENVVTHNFCSQEEMGRIYRNTDVAIARSGATTLAEMEAFYVKMVLVPLPESANNHQLKNAEIYEKKGAILIQEYDLYALGQKELEKLKGWKKTEEAPSPLTQKLQTRLSQVFTSFAPKK